MMSGIPAPLYHYGSYIIPSVLRALSDIPAINISTAFWLPFGAILSGLGAFVFGNGLWGKREGVACALIIALIAGSIHVRLWSRIFQLPLPRSNRGCSILRGSNSRSWIELGRAGHSR